MLDAKLIAAAIASRSAFERMHPHITDKDLGPYAQFWWRQLEAWYERDTATDVVDLDVFVELGKRAVRNEKHLEALVGFITSLPDAPSPENIAQAVLELRRHNVGLELAQAITSNDNQRVIELMELYDELLSATDLKPRATHRYAKELEELDQFLMPDNRIQLSPGRLNDRLSGGVWPGSHILVFGRTNMGKSTLSINMAAGFIWGKQKVLYAGTEDSIDILKARMRSRVSGMTLEEVQADPKRANAIYRERTEGKLEMVQFESPTITELSKVIEEVEPTVLILDQIRSLRVKGDGMTAKLEEAGIAIRTLTLRYNLVTVSVTQANDRSQKYGEHPPADLGISDIDSSRTGLPGTADLIIGVGADACMLLRGQRLLSLPKNKFSSAKDASTPLLVQFDTARSKVQ